MQATGLDSSQQKQYFYSETHKKRAAQEKYCGLIQLGKKLPTILRDINGFLQRGNDGDIDQNVMDALALRVMILCNFRVGNEKNLRKYNTYGLTTITKDHVHFGGASTPKSIRIKFNGKKQQVNECVIKDKKTIDFLKKLTQHRGKLDKSSHQSLFTWHGFSVTPDSLNTFLYKYSPGITTKTWRTWFANIQYINQINSLPNDTSNDTKTARLKQSNTIIKDIAKDLHHTVAINKRNYLMKELIDLYVHEPQKWNKLKHGSGKQSSTEQFFLSFLKSYCHM
jgi:DNA topoisomerase IB